MKSLLLGFILCATGAAFLGGCAFSYTKNQNKFSDRVVREKKLKDGKILMVGFKAALPAWGCVEVDKEAPNDGFAGLKSNFVIGGMRGLMINQAVKYAETNPGKNINYTYVDIADQAGIDGVSMDLADSFVHYYSCQNPPAKHSNPFKD